LKQRLHHSLILGQKCGEEVGIVDHRVTPGPSQFAGVAESFLGLYGQSLWSNHCFLTETASRPSGAALGSVGHLETFQLAESMGSGIPSGTAGLAERYHRRKKRQLI